MKIAHEVHQVRQKTTRIEGEQAVILSLFGFVICGNGNSVEARVAGTML